MLERRTTSARKSEETKAVALEGGKPPVCIRIEGSRLDAEGHCRVIETVSKARGKLLLLLHRASKQMVRR